MRNSKGRRSSEKLLFSPYYDLTRPFVQDLLALVELDLEDVVRKVYVDAEVVLNLYRLMAGKLLPFFIYPKELAIYAVYEPNVVGITLIPIGIPARIAILIPM